MDLRTREGRLYAAGILFAVGSAIHTFDHLRRGQGRSSLAIRALRMVP